MNVLIRSPPISLDNDFAKTPFLSLWSVFSSSYYS